MKIKEFIKIFCITFLLVYVCIDIIVIFPKLNPSNVVSQKVFIVSSDDDKDNSKGDYYKYLKDKYKKFDNIIIVSDTGKNDDLIKLNFPTSKISNVILKPIYSVKELLKIQSNLENNKITGKTLYIAVSNFSKIQDPKVSVFQDFNSIINLNQDNTNFNANCVECINLVKKIASKEDKSYFNLYFRSQGKTNSNLYGEFEMDKGTLDTFTNVFTGTFLTSKYKVLEYGTGNLNFVTGMYFGDCVSEDENIIKKEINKTKIAYVWFNENMQNWNDDVQMRKIKELKRNGYLVIVNISWSEGYKKSANKRQIAFSHRLIDNGVNFVVGHHSDVVEDKEIYKGVPIFYSIGNDETKDLLGVIFALNKEQINFNFVKYNQKPTDFDLNCGSL